MIPKECKRMAEVDFPIAEVSRHAVREKSIKRGNPSALHLWWARRPLASSRAMLLALLLPDPCDPHCPDDFKAKAQIALHNLSSRPARWDTELQTDTGLRKAILTFIADFANWDNAANQSYLTTGRTLVQAAHTEEPPLVVDPFAGGGSIPLETLRLGCDAFASDLNPVACLILKVMLEVIPRHGPGLADELRHVGAEIKAQVEKELANLYPKDPDGATPVAYLWARTVRCESPNCGAEIPLIRSMWLCHKDDKDKTKWALHPVVTRPVDEPPQVDFEIFVPASDREVCSGTVVRAKATCVCCNTVLPPDRVRSQLTSQQGGADTVFNEQGIRIGGARLAAVVTLRPDKQGRYYRLPTETDYSAVRLAQERVQEMLDSWEHDGKQNLCPIPNEPLPLMSGTFNVPLYGINTWGDLFAARQKAALVEIVRQMRQSVVSDGLRELLACVFSVFLRSCNGNARLRPDSSVAPAFGMQALPITWTFPETTISGGRSENFDGALSKVAQIVEQFPPLLSTQPEQADAADHPLPDESAGVWFTDPPYYFAIPYADLSDFFFVWLKRAMPDHRFLRDPFDLRNVLTPKQQELCEMAHWDPNRYAHKDQQFFENGMAKAFAEGRRVLSDDGIGSVVFAHKTTEGWEALLSGMIRGGWTITGSWPVATESKNRLRARKSAALATSVHLICRPRPTDAPVGDWSDVLRELPIRVSDWMERLQSEGVRGADLVFACVGPALEIFSRYSVVETAVGDEVKLSEYLAKVWEVVGRAALEQVLGIAESQARNGAIGTLEEDARLTALFLWTLQSSSNYASGVSDEPADTDNEEDSTTTGTRQKKVYQMLFDVTRRFAQPLGINLDEWKSRIIEIDKGVVRLISVSERSKQLFGADGASALADEIEADATASPQLSLFPEAEPTSKRSTRRGRKSTNGYKAGELSTRRYATTLDRVHAAMLFQDSGRSQALRALIQSEQDKGPDFLRLANALSALYPNGSYEKRLLDAMLLAVPR